MGSHRLRLDHPAAVWTEALPLGDGRLGAMVFGDPRHDRFALNHDTLWSGSPASELAGGAVPADVARAALLRAERALADGDPLAADSAVTALQQRYTQAYLPLADLVLEAADWSGEVIRELDLRTAVHELVGAGDDRHLTRRSYVSAADGVLVVESHDSAAAELRLGLDTPLRTLATEVDADEIVLTLRAPSDVAPTHARLAEPVRYEDDPGASVQAVVALRITSDGEIVPDGDGLLVRGARHVRVLLAAATTFTGIGQPPDPDVDVARRRALDQLAAACQRAPEEMLARHVAEHARLYDRVDLTFSPSSTAGTGSALPPSTTDRLTAARAHPLHPLAADPGLAELLFHYGRYLLICSSRPGTLPATLQGIWNAELQPPWSSSYTVNINTQMNYWGAEGAALPELAEPLLDLLEALAVRGEEVARRIYDRPGWVAHHNTDAWAHASPVGMGEGDPSWAFWPMAAPWLVRHLGEALRHGAPDATAQRAWPLVRGAAEFVLAWLTETDGVPGTPLSTSPENTFVVRDAAGADVGTAALARSAAMDLELVRDVLGLLLELADRREDSDDDVVRRAEAVLPMVPVPAVDADGGVREWGGAEQARDPQHRHLSMLYGLFPGDRALSDDERTAVGRSLDLRGDDSSGWSLVWKLALRARLGQPERVQDLLALMLRDATVRRGEWAGGVYPNLFAAHPPFQIDANLGLVGALLETLVHSHAGELVLLPALPPLLGTGSARGLRVRPGVTVDLAWADGVPTSVSLRSDVDRALPVRWGSGSALVTLTAGRASTLDLGGAA